MNIMYASQPNNFGYPGAGIPPAFPQMPPQPPQQQYYGNNQDHLSQTQPPPPPQSYQHPNTELMQHVRRNCCGIFNDWSNCPFTRGFLWTLVIYLVLSALVVLTTFEFIGTPLKMASTALAFVAIKKQKNVLMGVFTGILAYDLVEWLLVLIGMMPSLYHVHKIPTFSYWILGLHFIIQQGLFAMSIVHLKKGPNPHDSIMDNNEAIVATNNETISTDAASGNMQSPYDQYTHAHPPPPPPFPHSPPCPPPHVHICPGNSMSTHVDHQQHHSSSNVV